MSWCTAGAGLVLPCLWFESVVSLVFYGLLYASCDSIGHVVFRRYDKFTQAERRAFKTNIGALFNASVSFTAIVHIVAVDHIRSLSKDPVGLYPHLLSYYGPILLGYHLFTLCIHVAHEIELSNQVERVYTSTGDVAPAASLGPLLLPSVYCASIVFSLQTKLFGIFALFIAVITFQEVFKILTILLRFSLQSATEKSLVYRIVDAMQYISFPLLRWFSGPYSTYLIYSHWRQFTEHIPLPMMAVYAVTIFYENTFTVLFAIRALLLVYNPEFLRQAPHTQ
ncbi:Pentacotripeptide-repeat region of PRORP domain-containing protein [Plasmodiophora brassicae]